MYLVVTMGLTIAYSFDIGESKQVYAAIQSLTELFVPITTMFTAIVGASFGVNVANVVKKG